MRKKNIILLIVLLSLGFAAISTTLIINGVVGVETNTDNYIDGLVFDNKSLRFSGDTIAEVSASGRTLSFTTQTMTSVNEISTVYFKIKNYSQYDATLGRPAISCYFVDNHEVDIKATSIGTTNEYVQLIPGHELDGDKILGGGVELSEESNVTVKQIKSYTGDASEVKFQCEINADAADSETSSIEKLKKTYELILDNNNNGISDIGDEIQVGTENFYVISHTDTEINALAKYNLNVGNKNFSVATGIQHESVRGYVSGMSKIGNVAFSKDKGWSYANNVPINIENEAYRVGAGVTDETMTALDALYTSNETTGIKSYEEYIQETINNASIRLITKDEIEVLINDGNKLSNGNNIKAKADEAGYSWLYSTSYWTESASSNFNVLGVDSGGFLYNTSFSYNACYGVRPVITIPLK